MANMQGDALVDEIRAGAAWVASRASHVRVDLAAIPVYAASLPPRDVPLESPSPREGTPESPSPRDGSPESLSQSDSAHIVGGGPDLRAAFFLTLDAINFGSGWFPTLRKREGHSGYYTIAMGLRDRFMAHGAWSAEELQDLDATALATTLGQDPDHELMSLFAASLNDLGAQISRHHDGDFCGPVRAASGAVDLVEELAKWDCFVDVSHYMGREVPLYKRAQIAVSDLQMAGVADFDDLHRLTLFADNLVPHVLRLDGVLRFDPELVEWIEAEQLLEHGSAEEVEMRCGAIHAAELIATERPDLTPQQIDNILWHRGGGPSYKAVPRPRSRCTAY